MNSSANGMPRLRFSSRSSLASSVRLAGAFHVTTGVPGRRAATNSATNPPRLEPSRPKRPSSRGCPSSSASTASTSSIRLATVVSSSRPLDSPHPAKVEARQCEPRRGERVAEQQVLVGVLGGVKTVTGDHTRQALRTIREMEHEGQLRGGKRHEVALDRYAHTRSNSRTALLESWNIVSSMGSRLILATSSATREASHGPESIALNSPP